MIKACLFDFDGTLADSMPVWSRKMFHILEQCGIDAPEGLLRTITPLGDRGTARYFRETLGVPLSEQELLARMDAYALPRYREEIPPKPGALDYLRTLRGQGLRLFLLTASPHRMFEPALRRWGAAELFEVCWCCDDFGRVKSDARIYTDAAGKIGVRPDELLFFDDNRIALQTAKSAGLPVAGVYDPSSDADWPAIMAFSDASIRDYRADAPDPKKISI